MKILRFLTAGNVDDGKSTLIGRLLYDANCIHSDQLNILQQQSQKPDLSIDLAFITDGLRTEREKGITIDVAYKYFSTKKRKFIIADTPGHEEYTRNMITGASNSDLIILLIDARNGISTQTRRHASLASLMGIKKAIIAINKIDLVGFSAEVFEKIRQDFENLRTNLKFDAVSYLPISALLGDNVVEKSEKTPWYSGQTLLQTLEEVEINSQQNLPARFQVQYILKNEEIDYQGYAGLISSGTLKVGDDVHILFSGKATWITKIEKHQKEVLEAKMGENVVLHFSSKSEIKRGDSLVKLTEEAPRTNDEFLVWIAWLGETPLDQQKTYLLQYGIKRIPASIFFFLRKWDMNEWRFVEGNELKMNEVAQICLKAEEPLHWDMFSRNNQVGKAILIDPDTFDTVAALIIFG